MRTFMHKPRESQPAAPARLNRPAPADHEQSRQTSPAHDLQRRLGNQATQRLLQASSGEPSVAAAAIQPRLTISQPQDAHEQEADRVAAQVMRMPARTLPCEGASAAAALLANGHVQAKRIGPGEAALAQAPAMVAEALHSTGQPLDAKTRDFFEPRFGFDLARVRVHTGEKAEQSADAINAAAYTAGRDIVFGRGHYAPDTSEGKQLLAHELTHTIQQGLQAPSSASVQRQPRKVAPPAADKLLKSLKALVAGKSKDYVAYKTEISKATAEEKKVALLDQALLLAMKELLAGLSFPRCVEALGRRAPTFDELKKISVVATAVDAAWKASDVGVNNAVAQAHEEGGWVLMNLIDGSFSIERAKAEGTDFLRVEPFPELENSVVVALFHTHPTPSNKPGPSGADKTQDKRRGVPNLVAASTKRKPNDYQVFLSCPPARKHLASDTRIPGPSGGIAP
jgi:hypothetical protein